MVLDLVLEAVMGVVVAEALVVVVLMVVLGLVVVVLVVVDFQVVRLVLMLGVPAIRREGNQKM